MPHGRTVTPLPPNAALEAELVRVLATPEGRCDPYPGYATMHRAGTSFMCPTLGIAAFCGYQQVHELLRSPSCLRNIFDPVTGLHHWKNWSLSDLDPQMEAAISEMFFDALSILLANPPDHTRLRSLVNRAFTPRRVAEVMPAIAARNRALLENLAARRSGTEVDLMADFAFPLSCEVIAALLGVPEQELWWLQGDVRTATLVFEAVSGDILEEAAAARQRMAVYFEDLVDQRASEPGDDLISALIEVGEGESRLDRNELISLAISIFSAGFENTANLIGNAVAALFAFPDELQVVRSEHEDDAAMAQAVEELVRYDSPVQFTTRFANGEITVDGMVVPDQTMILLLLGAANHDPQRFAHPDRLDVRREEGPPISFGGGIHHCLGAPLAKAVGREALRTLVSRFERMQPLFEQPDRQDAVAIRGPSRLPVVLHPT